MSTSRISISAYLLYINPAFDQKQNSIRKEIITDTGSSLFYCLVLKCPSGHVRIKIALGAQLLRRSPCVRKTLTETIRHEKHAFPKSTSERSQRGHAIKKH
ncbi:hypothetical protein CEXT_176541 [Caerostris extrusa]|uniref:Uncharacterized protein n=1 Tax=Caerostris extrusa TaxID=172846 RepID=A0AAV4NG73_CAEEX|nr:hypothetical protein CEXT_176541 [Caerostris extrusa]